MKFYMLKVSKVTDDCRLHTEGCILADIGSRHASADLLCPAYHCKSDCRSGGWTVKCRKSSVRDAAMQQQIDVRKGDGLEVIKNDDRVECVTISGMGGSLITSILERGKEKLISVKRLILQPNVAAHLIRKWLIENNWELIGEEILEEDGHIYEILIAEKGWTKPYKDIPKELFFGPSF